MKTLTTAHQLNEALKPSRIKSEIIGFVPTMGALHIGHISLVSECRKSCDICVVSIFVNPTQFNDKSDLENYPRMPEEDLRMLEKAKVDFVFYPSIDEMYPEKDTRVFDFGGLAKVMEGAHRPGHFNGVAQIVSKLFAIVNPDKAFFGEKDFQQVAIIKRMEQMLNLNVEIVPCETKREEDGLAMSSRNMLLKKEDRRNASIIRKLLLSSVEMQHEVSIADVKKYVVNALNEVENFKTEYFEIVNADTLQPLKSWDEEGPKAACVAVYAGAIRLIDNIRYSKTIA